MSRQTKALKVRPAVRGAGPHNPNLKYIARLDSVRFGAVFFVLLQHLFGLTFLPWGHLGVSLFFVLSGFLITGILLRERERIGTGELSRKKAIGQFYWRRTVRIFPLYFAVVLVFAVLLDVGGGRGLWKWLFSYTMNYRIWLQHYEDPVWSGFWSLAVEEHFYLIWPAIILLAPKRIRIPATLTLITLGPLWRAWAIRYGINDIGLRK